MSEEILRIQLTELTGVIRFRLPGAHTTEFDSIDDALEHFRIEKNRGQLDTRDADALIKLLESIKNACSESCRYEVEFTLPATP